MSYQTRVPYTNTTNSYAPRRLPSQRTVATQRTTTNVETKQPRMIKQVYFWIVVVIAVVLGIIVGVLWFYLQTYRKQQYDTTLCPTYIPPTTCPPGCTGTPTT